MRSVHVLRANVAGIGLTLAQWRFAMALDNLTPKYRPDQPRKPKGTSEGGQWTAIGGQNDGEPVHVAFGAKLLTERVGPGDAGLVRHCIYIDMLGRLRTIEVNAMVSCRPTYPAAPL